MELLVRIESVKDLVEVARVDLDIIAQHLGLSRSMAGLKVRQIRPVFLDEIPKLTEAINSTERVEVTEADVVDLFGGKERIKVRGYLEQG
jgi:DNA polymerase II small subunit/DNA polymerase delta subunit B